MQKMLTMDLNTDFIIEHLRNNFRARYDTYFKTGDISGLVIYLNNLYKLALEHRDSYRLASSKNDYKRDFSEFGPYDHDPVQFLYTHKMKWEKSLQLSINGRRKSFPSGYWKISEEVDNKGIRTMKSVSYDPLMKDYDLNIPSSPKSRRNTT